MGKYNIKVYLLILMFSLMLLNNEKKKKKQQQTKTIYQKHVATTAWQSHWTWYCKKRMKNTWKTHEHNITSNLDMLYCGKPTQSVPAMQHAIEILFSR